MSEVTTGFEFKQVMPRSVQLPPLEPDDPRNDPTPVIASAKQNGRFLI